LILILLFAPLTVLYFILFEGNYNALIFFFIAASTFIPPIIFKYRLYPHRSIYAFLILWITFPKHIRYLPFIGTYYLPGIGYFDILQTIAALHIIVYIFIKRYRTRKRIIMPNNIRLITNIYFGTVLFTTVAAIVQYYFLGLNFSYSMVDGLILEDFANPYFGLIMLLGLFAFITNYKQLETILAIFAFSGILLLIEHLLMSYYGFFDYLNIYAYAADQLRFNSLIFSSYDQKGIFCIISAFSILYFAIKKKMYYLFPLTFFMIFPIQATYQRTIYLGFFLGTLTFILIYLNSKKLITKFVVLYLLLAGIILSIGNTKNVLENVNTFIVGEVRPGNVADTGSWYGRLGLWFRTADLFIYNFPIGVGEGMSPLYFNSYFVPAIFRSIIPASNRYNTTNFVINFLLLR